MLMTLGFFIFALDTVPFDSLDRERQARWASGNRVGRPPAHQFLGVGEETMTLEATLYPELSGGPEAVETLYKMMASGKAWVLLSGEGAVIGNYVITKIKDTMSVLEKAMVGGTGERRDGHAPVRAKKIVLSISLTRYDGPAEGMGHLPDSDPQGQGGAQRQGGGGA